MVPKSVPGGECYRTEVVRCRVVSGRSAVVTAGEEAILEGYVTRGWPKGRDGLVEGLSEVERAWGFIVGRGLVEPEDRWLLVRILNPGANLVLIYKDMGLATLEEVDPCHNS